MKCECNCGKRGQPTREAVDVVWCPGWINLDNRTLPLCNPREIFKGCPRKNQVTDKPPQHVCEECSRTFKPEFNPHAAGGLPFYWGEEAWEAFRKAWQEVAA